jgi:hypothetical protein
LIRKVLKIMSIMETEMWILSLLKFFGAKITTLVARFSKHLKWIII